MSSNLQRLREQREEAGRAIFRLRDAISEGGGREFTAEERANWDKANRDFDSANAAIEAINRTDVIGRALNGNDDDEYRFRPGQENSYPLGRNGAGRRDSDPADYDVAVDAMFRSASGLDLENKHYRACRRTGMMPGRGEFGIRLSSNPNAEYRAQGTTSTGAGGATVPQGFRAVLDVALKQYTAVRRAGCTVLRTATGNPMPQPTLNDTANVGTLLAENTTVGASVDMTFAQITFNAYKFSSGLVLVSSELDQDNDVGLGDRMGGLLGERIGRGQEPYFTTGTGSSQPQGIVTAATTGVTTASSTAIASDEIIKLYHSVDPAYRIDPSCGWMMHDNILLSVRLLKDAQNRYLWVANNDTSIVTDLPGTLLGKPITVNQSMDSTVTTGKKTILFGAMSKFTIRDAGEIRVRRLVERYADVDQIGFIAFLRSESKLVDAGTHPLKLLVQL